MAFAQETDADNPLKWPERDYLRWATETANTLGNYFKALDAAEAEILATTDALPGHMGVVPQNGGWVFSFGKLDARFFVSFVVTVDKNGSVRDLQVLEVSQEADPVASASARALAHAHRDLTSSASQIGLDPKNYRFASLVDGDYIRVMAAPRQDGTIDRVVFGGDLMYTYIALTSQPVGRSFFHKQFQTVDMESQIGRVANFTDPEGGMPSPFDVLNVMDYRVPVTLMTDERIYYLHPTGKVEPLSDDHPMMRSFNRARQEMMERMRGGN